MNLPIQTLAIGAAAGAAVAYALRKHPALGAAIGAGGALVIDQYLQSQGRVGRVAPRPAPTKQGQRLQLKRPMMTLVARRQTGAAPAASQSAAQDAGQEQAAPQETQDVDSATWSDWGQQVAQEDQVGWVGNEALDPIYRAIYASDHGAR